MNHDGIKQFNREVEELKPHGHQRALKMAVLKALQTQKSKRRERGSWSSFLSIFSMTFTKTVAVGFGVLVIAVAAVAAWNPIMRRLGFGTSKTTHASAQELLKLTREQYNGLSGEERKRLAESVQGNLEQIWQEAEQAKDLQFLQGIALQKFIREDTQRALGLTIPSSTMKMVEEIERDLSNKMKQSAFRYTDPQGKITYINLTTYETLPEGVVMSSKTTINVTKFSAAPPEVGFEEKMKVEFSPEKMKELERKARENTLQITPEFRQKAQEMMEKKLQKYYPEVLAKWKMAKEREIYVHSLLDGTTFQKDMTKSKFYVSGDNLEMLQNNTEATIQEVDVNQMVNLETQYMVNANLIDEHGKRYFIIDSFDSAKPDEIKNSLLVEREK